MGPWPRLSQSLEGPLSSRGIQRPEAAWGPLRSTSSPGKGASSPWEARKTLNYRCRRGTGPFPREGLTVPYCPQGTQPSGYSAQAQPGLRRGERCLPCDASQFMLGCLAPGCRCGQWPSCGLLWERLPPGWLLHQFQVTGSF